MNEHLKLLESKREKFLELTKNLTVEQYNHIPDGFNNNIIWNMGHTLYVGQNYLYNKSGFVPPIHPICLEKFSSGTKPEEKAMEPEILYIRNSLLDSVRFLEQRESESADSSVVDQLTSQISRRSLEFVLFHDNYHYNTITNMMSSF